MCIACFNTSISFWLLYIFVQREKALNLFEQLKGLGIKPNAMTYALLVDAHLIVDARIVDDTHLIESNQESALAIIEEMVIPFSSWH